MKSHFEFINNLRLNVRTIFIKIIQQSFAIECAIKKRYAIYYYAQKFQASVMLNGLSKVARISEKNIDPNPLEPH